MSKLVIINLGNGKLKTGFPAITAMLWEANNSRPVKFTGSLPPAPNLIDIYRRWQLVYKGIYSSFGLHPRLEIINDEITNFSIVEFSGICNQYITSINNWLNSYEFLNIDRQIRSLMSPAEEIQIIIESDDMMVRRLPWELWNFFQDYPKAEIALSDMEYKRKEFYPNLRKKIRILAILGNSKGIDIAADKQLLSTLPNAEIVFLVEPLRQEINEYLWDKNGWDILFFAGHSESNDSEATGLMYINPQDKITIEQLKPALKKAIERGLQLAIFNSCDGLGLANKLVDLQIPLMIVMREAVPDLIAQQFLKYFINAFSRGESFYLAVREARERLHALEDKFPCASWLPVTYQNPAILPMKWESKNFLNFIKNPTSLANSKPNYPTWGVSIAIAILVIIIRQLGILQPLELKAFDQLMQLRPVEAPDPRLLVVKLTETDINNIGTWPIDDLNITRLLEKIQQHKPRVIGFTIYRNLPVYPGNEKLKQQLQTTSNIVAICKVKDNNNSEISPLPYLPKENLGFDDLVVDPDGILRRHLLFMNVKKEYKCDTEYSLSIRLANLYLEHRGIKLKKLLNNSIQWGNTIFNRLEPNQGGYHNIDSRGFQILLNYRSNQNIAQEVTFTDILNDQFDPNWITDKIIIIGVTANSIPNEFFTPYSTKEWPVKKISGVMVQAQMVSQIISAILDDRPLLRVWDQWSDILWISIWSLIGGTIAANIHHKKRLTIAIICANIILFLTCFILFIQGWWVPLLPPLLVIIGNYFYFCVIFSQVRDK